MVRMPTTARTSSRQVTPDIDAIANVDSSTRGHSVGASVRPAGRLQRSREERINWIESIPFFLIHVAALAGIIWVTPTWRTALWGVFRYYAGMFLVTGVYHRYFSHRSYRMNRGWQFVAAFLACTNAQKGPIWWSGMHEWHHLYADEQPDWHTPWKDFWWAHVGWILCDATKVAPARFTRRWDEHRFPELNWLDRHYLVPPILLGVIAVLFGGWSGLFWSFIIPTVALYHGTFFINSLAHLPSLGSRRFDVPNTSRNIWWLWPVTLGENYHNNHHHERWAARQGITWWEIDPTYYGLKLLSWIQIPWITVNTIGQVRLTAIRMVSDLKPHSREALSAT